MCRNAPYERSQRLCIRRWKVVQASRAEGALFGHVVAVPTDIPPETLALPAFDEAESELESSAHGTFYPFL